LEERSLQLRKIIRMIEVLQYNNYNINH